MPAYHHNTLRLQHIGSCVPSIHQMTCSSWRSRCKATGVGSPFALCPRSNSRSILDARLTNASRCIVFGRRRTGDKGSSLLSRKEREASCRGARSGPGNLPSVQPTKRLMQMLLLQRERLASSLPSQAVDWWCMWRSSSAPRACLNATRFSSICFKIIKT